jgi:hypothetical protein
MSLMRMASPLPSGCGSGDVITAPRDIRVVVAHRVVRQIEDAELRRPGLGRQELADLVVQRWDKEPTASFWRIMRIYDRAAARSSYRRRAS